MIVVVAAVNIMGTSIINRVQSIIVVLLLAVFGVFIVVMFGQMDTALLSVSRYPPAVDIISSIALTFFAFLGFAVISFTGGDLPEPERSRLTISVMAVLLLANPASVIWALTAHGRDIAAT